MFWQPFFQAFLRCDAGDQAGLWLWQKIVGRLAIQHHRLTDLFQVCIGANGRKLGRPGAAGIGAKGFVVVPEKGVGHSGFIRGYNCYTIYSYKRLLYMGYRYIFYKLLASGPAHARQLGHQPQHLVQAAGVSHFHGEGHPRRALDGLGLHTNHVHFFFGEHLGNVAQ